jgi:hypothetical protein
MTEDQILRLIRRAQQSSPKRGAARIELPAEPKEVEDEYFNDPFRPRLSSKAFLVWAYLLRRTEPESRIALVSSREIRLGTGIHSAGGVRAALLELAHYCYCTPGLAPTGPGLPRNYKIPLHIGSAANSPSQAAKLHGEAERPRRASGTALRKIRKALQEAQAGPAKPQPDLAPAPPPVASPAGPSPQPGAPSLQEIPLVLIERQPEPKASPPRRLDAFPKTPDPIAPAPPPPDPANADIIQAIVKLDQEIAQMVQAKGRKERQEA